MHSDRLEDDPIRAARDELAQPGVRPADTKAPGERPGDLIDRYKLLQEIGAGGMGTVWMAEQKEPVVRKVALKIIKLGMDTRDVVTRFEAERQALALMDHPGIAKVLDGGSTASGRPFFVMELVRGVPITQYCDEAKAGLRERLELFAKVCEAIQHAHHKGIIHRDVKPSNVLITLHDGTPLPKVIDFGIAKATSAELTQKTMFTQYAQMVGTPEYMAPEQAAMSALDVDTRADVYSLGVLLYELLTGTKPFEMTEVLEKGYQELLRTIREDDPAKPSTRVSTLGEQGTTIAARRHVDVEKLKRHLRGDLDWIVMKALEKDRTRRYETANGMALDVRRYLQGDAVLAAPPSAVYRLRKFVTRRKGLVAAVAGIALVVLLGAIGTGIGWYEARLANHDLGVAIDQKDEQRKLAEAAKARAETAETAARADAERARLAEAAATQRAAELQQVSEFQSKQLADLDVERMGVGLRLSLFDAVPKERRAELETAIETVNFTSLALALLEQNLFQRTLDAIGVQFADQPLVEANLLQAMASTLRSLDSLQLAETAQARALDLFLEQLGPDSPIVAGSRLEASHLEMTKGQVTECGLLREEVLRAYDRANAGDSRERCSALVALASVRDLQSRHAEAEALLREADLAQQRLGITETEAGLSCKAELGRVLTSLGRPKEGEPYLRAALEVAQKLGLARLGNTVRSELANNLLRQDRLEEFGSVSKEAMEISRRLLGDEHSETQTAISTYCVLLDDAGRAAEAEPLLRDSVSQMRARLGDAHYLTLGAILNLCRLLCRKGDLEEARRLMQSAETAMRVLGEDHALTVRAELLLAELAFAAGDAATVESKMRRVVERMTTVMGPSHPLTIEALSYLSGSLGTQGKFSEELPVLDRAIEAAKQTLGGEHLYTLTLTRNRGVALFHLDRFAEAAPILEAVVPLWRRRFGDGHPQTKQTIRAWFDTALALGRAEEALPVLDEAIEAARSPSGHDPSFLVEALTSKGRFHREAKRGELALALSREAYEQACTSFGSGSAEAIECGANLSIVLMDDRGHAEAEPLLRNLLPSARSLEPKPGPRTRNVLRTLGRLLFETGQFPEAAPMLDDAYRLDAEALGEDHIECLYTLLRLLRTRVQLGETEAAIAGLADGASRASSSLGAQHVLPLEFRDTLWVCLANLGRVEDALALARPTVRDLRAVLGDEHPTVLLARSHFRTLLYQAKLWDEAVPLLVEAAAQERAAARASSAAASGFVSMIASPLLDVLTKRGPAAEAIAFGRELLAEFGPLLDDAPSIRATLLGGLGRALLSGMESQEAERVLREFVTVLDQLAPDEWAVSSARSVLGEALMQQQRWAEAEALMNAGYDGMRARLASIAPPHRYRVREALTRLVTLHERWHAAEPAKGHDAKAEDWRRESEAFR
ncbi:MAG: serine/threonine protein kinase [Planctomycetes bacterium]|nr:serine/threonine protein kinase [Planctomycetota bacterium]